MSTSVITVGGEQRGRSQLRWTNEQSPSFRFVPHELIVTLDIASWRVGHPDLDAAQISIPATWVSDGPVWKPVTGDTQTLSWRIMPREKPRSFDASIRATGFVHGRPVVTAEHMLAIEIAAWSQFDPARHAIMTPNTVAGWGSVTPRYDVFERTYGLAIRRTRFFDGLYRAIVFLGDQGQRYQGGVCTGMARFALEQSLASGKDEPLLDQVLIWHGRQLCDRALLASAWWFLFPSPKRAFEAFRRQILEDGTVARCFDIGVPKPWRWDIVAALQEEGHTVVPFAFRQHSAGAASVLVYDPNDPESSVRGRCVLTFQLDRNTYQYPAVASADDRRTTIIATGQASYRRARTAILASAVSEILNGWSALRARRPIRTRRWANRPSPEAGG